MEGVSHTYFVQNFVYFLINNVTSHMDYFTIYSLNMEVGTFLLREEWSELPHKPPDAKEFYVK